MAFSQFPLLVRCGRLGANLTALAPQSAPLEWVQAGLSAANIAILYRVKPAPLDVYSFAYDGTSWTFVNAETFPDGGGCNNPFGGCLKLGGNLMVFRPGLDSITDNEFQTFQWQGTS